MSEEDPSVLGGLWEAAEGAYDAAGHGVEAGVEAMETAGDTVIGYGTHVAASGAFLVGATDTANEWQEEAESWYDEAGHDAGQIWNEGMGAVDAVAGTDYYDPSLDDSADESQ